MLRAGVREEHMPLVAFAHRDLESFLVRRRNLSFLVGRSMVLACGNMFQVSPEAGAVSRLEEHSVEFDVVSVPWSVQPRVVVRIIVVLPYLEFTVLAVPVVGGSFVFQQGCSLFVEREGVLGSGESGARVVGSWVLGH